LGWIGNVPAIIAGVTDPVSVGVRLVDVERFGAVIMGIGSIASAAVTTDATAGFDEAYFIGFPPYQSISTGVGSAVMILGTAPITDLNTERKDPITKCRRPTLETWTVTFIKGTEVENPAGISTLLTAEGTWR